MYSVHYTCTAPTTPVDWPFSTSQLPPRSSTQPKTPTYEFRPPLTVHVDPQEPQDIAVYIPPDTEGGTNEGNPEEDYPIAVELSLDSTSETQELFEAEPEPEAEEFPLSQKELQRSIDAFERSIQRRKNLSNP